MFEPHQLEAIRGAIERQTDADRAVLESLRQDVDQHLKPSIAIRPHSATAVSLVASDGGNNKLVFDPFSMQLVRVVDSHGNQLFLDVVSPTTDPDELLARHKEVADDPLALLMDDLGLASLNKLSPMIPKSETVREAPDDISPSWVLVYRDLCEWAVLYQRITQSIWGSHTLIVRDGLLRSKIFAGTTFVTIRDQIVTAIERHRERNIKLFLVGIAKHSQVLARYRLALALQHAMPAEQPRYIPVPREIEEKVYKWKEYAVGREDQVEGGEKAKFVAGSLYLARFGTGVHDPVWAVDLLETQVDEASEIFGYLLADAREGFPVPFYPRCLQLAHEHAQVVGFDMDILQDTVLESARGLIETEEQKTFDAIRLSPDVSGRRYE